jgi:WhiB family redox-sensing transcriptional regulator
MTRLKGEQRLHQMNVPEREAFEPPRRSWWKHARCRNLPKELFFPEDEVKATMEKAKEVCFACQVREICLEDALRRETGGEYANFGVFGGMTPKERFEVRRRSYGYGA